MMTLNLVQKTTDEINHLINRKFYIIKDKTSEKILKCIVNDPKESFPDHPTLDKSLKLLIKNKLVTFDGVKYAITEYGQYIYLTKKLNIRFLSLCALSEIYVMQSNFSNPKNGSYLTTRFIQKLEYVYSPNTLRTTFVRLGMAGYVCRKSKKKVYIPHSVYLKIKKHDVILRNLQKWFAETCDKIDDLINSDPNVRLNIKNNTF